MNNRFIKNTSVFALSVFFIFICAAGLAHAQTAASGGNILTTGPNNIQGTSGYVGSGNGNILTSGSGGTSGTGSGGDSILTNSVPIDTSISQTPTSLLNPANNSLLGGTSNGTLGAGPDGAAAATSQAAPSAAPTTAAAAATRGCSWSSFNISDCLLNGIALFIFGLANTLLALAGVVLNLVVLRTIFQFSSLIGNSPGLLVGWGLLRDISNMLLLFGFVYIGISTILGLSTYTVKKTLPRLLIFAVLLNFSLFAAEGIIDVSNLFSSVMYSQANTGTCQPNNSFTGSTNTDANCAVNYGIAGHIMQSTGLSSVFASNAAGSGVQEGATLVGLALFAIIGTVVIIAMAIMFSIRAIVLTFVMVTAPIGFAGMAIPQLNKLATRWWDALIKQSFFAPVMLILVFVSLKVTDSFGRNGSLGAALGNSNVDTISVIFIFVIVCGFLLASLKIASDMGAAGSKMAIGFATRNTGRLTLGAAAFVGRRTVGGASAKASQFVEKSKFFRDRPFLYRNALAVTDKGANSSFDIRATKTFGDAVKSAGKQTGVNLDFGKPGKNASKGYNQIVKDAQDRRKKAADRIKPNTEEQAAIDQENKNIKEAEKRIKDRDADAKNRIDSVQADSDQKIKSIRDAAQQERDDIQSKLTRAGTNLNSTKAQIESIAASAGSNAEDFAKLEALETLRKDQQKAVTDLESASAEKLATITKAIKLETDNSREAIKAINAERASGNKPDTKIISDGKNNLDGENGLNKQPKQQHADALARPILPWSENPGYLEKKAQGVMDVIIPERVAYRQAAKAVRDDINKNKDQKTNDAIIKAIKEANKGEDKPKEEKADEK